MTYELQTRLQAQILTHWSVDRRLASAELLSREQVSIGKVGVSSHVGEQLHVAARKRADDEISIP